jgi:putative sterol carrier protein
MSKEEHITAVEKLRDNFLNEKAKKTFRKWNKTMGVEFTDIDKIYYFNIEAGVPGDVTEGIPEKINVKITTDTDTWVKIMNGELGGMKAYTSKKLKVKGSMPDLLKLQKLMK